jgi:hypothetical protein
VEAIESISTNASKEWSLQSAFTSMREDWEVG